MLSTGWQKLRIKVKLICVIHFYVVDRVWRFYLVASDAYKEHTHVSSNSISVFHFPHFYTAMGVNRSHAPFWNQIMCEETAEVFFASSKSVMTSSACGSPLSTFTSELTDIFWSSELMQPPDFCSCCLLHNNPLLCHNLGPWRTAVWLNLNNFIFSVCQGRNLASWCYPASETLKMLL